MTQETKKRRTTHSRISVPLRDPRKRDAIAAVGIGFTMIVIMALYAASFPRNRAFQAAREANPRWGVITRKLFDAVEPTFAGLNETKSRLAAVLDAKLTQERSIELLKQKLEAASGTPETASQN